MTKHHNPPLTRSEIQRRSYLKHKLERDERARKWRASHREYIAVRNRKYKQEYRERMTEVDIAKRTEYNRRYRALHRDELSRKYKIWREQHKEERRLYDRNVWSPKVKLRRRKDTLNTTLNGKPLVIKGLLKRCYPTDSRCELCHGVKGRLAYHHWEDTEEIAKRASASQEPLFLKGIWVCQPCNNFIHRLTQFPNLPSVWFELKHNIEQPMREELT